MTQILQIYYTKGTIVKEKLESLITNIPDFPKKGVMFKDINPLLEVHLKEVVELMSKQIDWSNIDAVIGIESRGFILGAAMAIQNNVGFIPIRKKGKLPPPVVSQAYTLEYGEDVLEMALNDTVKRVVLVDDVLATGGTYNAARELCLKNNYDVKAFSVVIDLQFLNQLHKEIPNLYSIFNY